MPIYLDNAATTETHPEVLEEMRPYLGERYGNPSSLYALAQEAREALDVARERVATAIGARRAEIIFTGGGSEADNMAVKGSAFALRDHGRHIVTSAVEHHAVLHSAEQLARLGWEMCVVEPQRNGVIDPQAVADAVRDDTVLVSVMLVNNEIGTINPIADIARLVKNKNGNSKGVLNFHSDAIQAVGKIDVNVKELGVDLLSLSAHKLNGPKGVGALFVRRGTVLEPLISGGGQERQKRAGTENVAAIVGFGKAVEIAMRDREREMNRLRGLRERLLAGIKKIDPDAVVHGADGATVATILNVSFSGVAAESVLIALDMEGVCVSSGSACSSASLDPSHVLTAIGHSADMALASVRFSLGYRTTAAEIEGALQKLGRCLERLRALPSTRSAGV